MKLIHQTTAFCRPSPGLQSFSIAIPGADAPGYYATAPERGSEFGSLRSRYLGGGTADAVVKNARWAW